MFADNAVSIRTDNELGLQEKSDFINSEIEVKLYENINSFPKAVYFIIPNELCERFCYHGISTLKFKFLMTAYGLTGETAKIVTHFFTALNLITPMIGSSISDSYLGKYHTILYFSILYLIGNMMVSIFSINGLLGEYGEYPIYSFILPALFFSLGTGGIKACVAFHGGDQFLEVQSKLREDFFSLFYATINAGALAAVFTTPYLRAYVNCFGSPCYPLAFGVPSIAFGISLILFVIGKRYYRVVPPRGEFLLWKSTKIFFLALKRSCISSENKSKQHWLHRSRPDYDFDLIEETRLLTKITLFLIPLIFYSSLYSQSSTEWQKHYEKMNKFYFGLLYVPTEASLSFNMVLVILLVPFLNYAVYPFLEKIGRALSVINRMIFGYFLMIISFIIAVVLSSNIDQHTEAMILKNNSVVSCVGCLNGAWQFPQIFILSLGEAFMAPSVLQFLYAEVGSQLKASAFSIYLLKGALGNCVVMMLEHPLNVFTSQTCQWVYISISTFWFVVFVFLSKKWFVSKDDEKKINLD